MTLSSTVAARPSPSTARPEHLGLEALAQLVESTRDGIALLDEELRVIYMNPAGCQIVGYPLEQLIGRTGVLMIPRERQDEVRQTLVERFRGGPQGARTTILRADGQEREIEYSGMLFEMGDRRVLAGSFRDTTEATQAERWARALARIASSVAFSSSLGETLDALAQSVVEAAGLLACGVILLEENPVRIRVAGTHGLPRDYEARFEEALATGLNLPAAACFEAKQRVIVRRSDGNSFVEALEVVDGDSAWSTVVCLPMVARGRGVGVVKGFFGPAHPPDTPRLEFLATIADQATMAVENARLFTEARQYSRRQEVLVQAGLALASELSLPAVLQKIVGLATEVADARYGALGVLGARGGLEDFITAGLSEAERAAIGHLPVGMGILGALITDAAPLRLRRIADDSRSVGFPPEHPPMSSFLGVPITVRGRVYGNLYLTEKRGAAEFTEADERAVVTLAAQAGVAIENARLFQDAEHRLALEERQRLARDLHDSVSQALFSMTLQTRGAQLALEKEGIDPAGPVGRRLSDLKELTEGALAEMRMLIFELRPGAMQEEGLVAAIRKLGQGIAARDALVVDVECPLERIALRPLAAEQLYRLTQEALTNVVKHARAHRVRVRISAPAESGELVLEISDDGVAFDPAVPRPGHLGLRTMAARAESLGGTLEVLTHPGKGTTVRAVIPAGGQGT
ncbi:MAG: GAF domain-containing protein [Actinomycetota bacterium]|nr:GAF domain-containing protein [Actinomycetota bacterium]